jgi:hypothetical protein
VPEQAFLCNVASLDEPFIFTGGGLRSGFGGGGGGGRGGLNTTFLRPMKPDTVGCGARPTNLSSRSR